MSFMCLIEESSILAMNKTKPPYKKQTSKYQKVINESADVEIPANMFTDIGTILLDIFMKIK